ncbi:hypothetical protein C8F04DRAFT_1270097 [Mycena alexandri]|uniref:Uncharacterized protein n=1 Tax=Mycena alexandri TaxID=1745969 RepID=A0AAD6SCP3_9AGAR|nr:hypothetical protein C8F04DRAFT_1270097 [Mycena alexandri]
MTDLSLPTLASGPHLVADRDAATFSLPPTKADQANLISTLQTLSDSVAAVSATVAAITDAPLSQGTLIGNLADLAAAASAAGHAAADVGNAAAAFQPPSPPIEANTPPPGFLQSEAPWKAGILYSVVPRAPLAAISDASDKWYAITRGKYVGITKNSALSVNAVIGVGSALSDRCSTLDEALDLFNSALAGNAIAILR